MSTHRPLIGLALIALLLPGSATAATPPGVRPDLPPPPDLPDDPTVWPNQESYRNSDTWLVENHAKITAMRPRVLVLSFANDVEPDAIEKQTRGFIQAFAEATRHHGFANPDAPPFITYDPVRFVDLRDDNRGVRENSKHFPEKTGERRGALIDYNALYSDEFARHYGFEDPKRPGEYLNLHELIHGGYVHELWYFAIHTDAGWPGRETIEFKQYYDEQAQPIPGKHGPAGNGHDPSMPWSGRSFRIAFFNPHRGIGCMLENFGHELEAIANHNSIAYYKKYFDEYAELNLKDRFDLPFRSFYRFPYRGEHVTYPHQAEALFTYEGTEHRLNPYINAGGNVHWPPGARKHYDLDSPHTVLSRIENFRQFNGVNGQDRVEPFSKDKWQRYAGVAPDCMGQWLVYWMQCMPGYENQALDDDGKPMKNWWPFMFY